MQFNLQRCLAPSILYVVFGIKSVSFPEECCYTICLLFLCYRFIVPMRNGDLDAKGLLARLIQSQGTMESFKVRFMLLLVIGEMIVNFNLLK